jgi:hypothetical protein
MKAAVEWVGDLLPLLELRARRERHPGLEVQVGTLTVRGVSPLGREHSVISETLGVATKNSRHPVRMWV